MRFLSTFLSYVALLAALYGGAVWLVDPYGFFGTDRFPVISTETRAQKTALFRAYQRRGAVECLILGSSRCMQFKPSIFEERLGLRTFNFGVPAAYAEDMLATYRYARSQGARPKLLILTFDSFNLHTVRDTSFLLLDNAVLRRTVEGLQTAPEAFLRSARHMKQAYSRPYLHLMVQSVRTGLGLLPEPRIYEPDGYLKPPYQPWKPGENWREEPRNVLIRQIVDWYRYHVGPAADRVRRIERLMAEAHRDGAKVVIWIPPTFPPAELFLSKHTRYRESVEITRAFARRFEERYGAVTVDFTDPARRPFLPRGWYDFLHFDQESADRTAAYLAERAR